MLVLGLLRTSNTIPSGSPPVRVAFTHMNSWGLVGREGEGKPKEAPSDKAECFTKGLIRLSPHNEGC